MEKLHHYLIRIYNIHKNINLCYFMSLGLSSGQPKILELLTEHNGCTQKFIADSCELRPATVTSLLKKMERDALITREPDTVNGGTRVTRIYLTENGRRLTEAVMKSVRRTEEKCFAGFGDAEREQCLSYLERIYGNIKK